MGNVRILTIDAGTTSMRGVVYNSTGDILFLTQKKTSPIFMNDSRVELDPGVWRDTLCAILSESSEFLDKEGGSLEAIALTAIRSPVFPVSHEGVPLMPAIMWQDKRTDGLCKAMKDDQAEVYSITGVPITSVFSAVKIRWFQENHPEICKKAAKMAGAYDYMLWLLCGRFVTDPSVAGRSNLLNLETLDWDDRLLNLFGVKREILAELLPPGTVCGGLTEEIAARTGLKSGTPVIGAGGDQQCAALGLGVRRPGEMSVCTGTGSYTLAHSEKPVRDRAMEVYCNPAAIPGKYVMETGLLTGGTLYRWFCETFTDSCEEEPARFKKIDGEMLQSPPGAKGILLIPRFKGIAGRPSYTTKGCFLNLDLNTTRGDMARALLEGIAMELSENIEKTEALIGKTARAMVTGGMSRFPLYNQMQADIFNLPVYAGETGEATSHGSLISALVAIDAFDSFEAACENLPSEEKVYRPNSENTPLYQSLLLKKKEICKSLETA